MATISNTPRPGYVWDSADNVWYPIGVGAHQHTNAADTPAVMPFSTYGAAGKNVFLNGAMQIWQRGTSFNATTGTTTAYSADRWTWWGGNSATLLTRQTTNDTTNLPGIQYCARVARPSGNTSTLATYFGQAVETINSIPLAGKTVTVSYYARAGANMSNTTIQPVLVSGTGTDQNYIHSAWTGFAIAASGTTTLTTTWTRYSFTGVVPINCTELTFQSYWIPSGTAGAADYYEITGIQLEIGSVPTAFQTATGNLASELAACQRYYQRFTSASVYLLGFGIAQNTTTFYGIIDLPTTMRVTPSVLDINLLRITNTSAGFSPSGAWSIYTNGSGLEKVCLTNSTFTGLTATSPYMFECNGGTAYVGLGAEL